VLLCCSIENLKHSFELSFGCLFHFLCCYYSRAASMVQGMAPLSKTAIMLGQLRLETEAYSLQRGAPLHYRLELCRPRARCWSRRRQAPARSPSACHGCGRSAGKTTLQPLLQPQSCFGVSNVQAVGTVLGLAPLSNTAITFGVLWLGEKGVEHTAGRWVWLAVFSGSLALWQAALFLHSRPDWLASLVSW